MPAWPQSTPQPALGIAERVRQILQSKGLTINEVSRWTETRHGRPSPFFISHNLYFHLRRGYVPKIHQVFALSECTGYRLVDWLSVFGVQLDDIPRLQALLPSPRTTLIDVTLYDGSAWFPWVKERPTEPNSMALTSLSQFLSPGAWRRAHNLVQRKENSPFVYASVGWQDALAFPDVLPGSVVRANSHRGRELLGQAANDTSDAIFLVEHDKGIVGSRLQLIGNRLILRPPRSIPYGQVEFRLGHDARILGVLDLEIRPLSEPKAPEVPAELAAAWQPSPLTSINTPEQFFDLVRKARFRSGRVVRDISTLSEKIVQTLGDSRYFAAPASLSHYESTDSPKDIHKIVSLCILYSIPFWSLLRSMDLLEENAGAAPIPDDLIPRSRPEDILDGTDPLSLEASPSSPSPFLNRLLARTEEVPAFLMRSFAAMARIDNLSLHDVFWVGEKHFPLHPDLENAILLAVNRRIHKPKLSRRTAFWQRPLYVLQRADGTFLCTCCNQEDDVVVLHPYASVFVVMERLHIHQDVEVVGQVVSIVRKLLP